MAKFLDYDGLLYFWQQLKTKFVAKETGKGLSTNDYTTAEKNKLAGIASGAEVNVNADWNATSGDAQILNKPSIPSKTSDLTNDSDFITSESIPTKTSELTNDSGFITSANVPVAATVAPKMDGTAAVGTSSKWAKEDHVHPTDTSRASADDLAILQIAIGKKVDKETGKGLSTNDFTTVLKNKLDGINEGAEVNPDFIDVTSGTQESYNINSFEKTHHPTGGIEVVNINYSRSGSPVNNVFLPTFEGFQEAAANFVPITRTINNKALSSDVVLDASDVGALPDDTAIPSKTSDLTNDSGFITSVPSASSTAPKMDGTAAVGTGTTWARADHVHPTDTSRQAKLTFDSAPTANSTNPVTSGGVKTYVDDAIGGITGIDFQIVTSLPATGTKGIIYLISNGGASGNSYDEYIWVTNKFEKIGTTDVDLSDYWNTTNLTAITNSEIDAIMAA